MDNDIFVIPADWTERGYFEVVYDPAVATPVASRVTAMIRVPLALVRDCQGLVGKAFSRLTNLDDDAISTWTDTIVDKDGAYIGDIIGPCTDRYYFA